MGSEMKEEKLQQTLPSVIQNTIRDDSQQLYDLEMENLEEMKRFLESYNVPKLYKEKVESINKSITSKNTVIVVNNLPKNEIPGPDGNTGEFYKTF